MITITHIQTNNIFLCIKEEWNTLLKQSSVDDAFLTWEWLSTWWKHYGHCYELCLLTAQDDGHLVGIAPLMIEQQKVLGLTVRVLRNIGKPPPDVAGFVIQKGREDVLEKFADWIVKNQKIWDVLIIREIPPGGMNTTAFEEQFLKNCFVSQVDTTRHFYVPMNMDWESYYQTLSKNLRKDLKKKIRYLQDGEGYKFSRKVGNEVTPQDIETIFKINQNARHEYLYSQQSEQDLHRELARFMAEKGWLDVCFLYVGDVPVAYRYGFCYNDCFEDWRTGFNTDYLSLSVGKILLFFVIQSSFERGYKSLHFLRGDEDYKLDWNVETQLFSHIQIVRRSFKSLFTHIYFPNLKKKLRHFLSQHENLRPLIGHYEQWISPK